MYSEKQQARASVSKSLKKKQSVLTGYHRMPDGSVMKGRTHPKKTKLV